MRMPPLMVIGLCKSWPGELLLVDVLTVCWNESDPTHQRHSHRPSLSHAHSHKMHEPLPQAQLVTLLSRNSQWALWGR